MNTQRPSVETVRRWALSCLLLVLVPKCLLCAAAWLGVLLGLAGPKLCGAP
jgi:predicted anti-sigma-YlaC factor YlaD